MCDNIWLMEELAMEKFNLVDQVAQELNLTKKKQTLLFKQFLQQ